MNFAIGIVVFLGILAFARIIRIYELSEELKGKEGWRISDKENRINSALMLLMILFFFTVFIYEFVDYRHLLLPVAASKHGPLIDNLFNVTTAIIVIVFFSTHSFLGWFAYNYYSRKGNKATFYTHNNKLEVIWTVVPTIVLTGLIFYGLIVWNRVMEPGEVKNPVLVEVYGKQFQWLARYPGSDGKLGITSFKKIEAANQMGLDSADANAWDDIITNELHMPVNKTVKMLCEAQDVIHSAYLPHFRVQMNCVPGMTTQFQFTPTITTENMRKELKSPDFDFELICNKICGAAHYTMKMKVVVENEDAFNKWLESQKSFFADMKPEPAKKPSPEGKNETKASI